MSEENPEGPFRDNARPPDPTTPWSYPAVASPVLVIGGWLVCVLALNRLEALLYVGSLMLLAGGAAGAFGLVETKPRVRSAREPLDAEQSDEPLPTALYQGRSLAKLGLGCLLGPVLLGCIGFGLLLLTCGGH